MNTLLGFLFVCVVLNIILKPLLDSASARYDEWKWNR